MTRLASIGRMCRHQHRGSRKCCVRIFRGPQESRQGRGFLILLLLALRIHPAVSSAHALLEYEPQCGDLKLCGFYSPPRNRQFLCPQFRPPLRLRWFKLGLTWRMNERVETPRFVSGCRLAGLLILFCGLSTPVSMARH